MRICSIASVLPTLVSSTVVLFAAPGVSASSSCPSDRNKDGHVNYIDLAQLVGSWDDELAHGGALAAAALAQLIGDWGPCPAAPAGAMRLGVAIGGITSYGRDASPWRDRLRGAEIHPASLFVDPNVWPLPTPTQPVFVLTDTGERPTPPGRYVVRYEGHGEVYLSDRGATGPHPWEPAIRSGDVVTVAAGHTGGVQAIVRSSLPGDPVRRVSFTPEGTAPGAVDPQWVAPLQGWCGAIRFLGWTRLDAEFTASDPSLDIRLTLADLPDHRRATMNHDADPGLAVQLAREAGADAWVCVMDGADDAYYRAYARAMAAQAGPGQRIIVEYSNEASWNHSLAQFHRINRRGLNAGLMGARAQYAREALACFRIMRSELGSRFRGVLGVQLANQSVALQVLEEAALAPDFPWLVHAIAPSWYWYPTLEPRAGQQTTTVGALVADCEREIRTTMRERLAAHSRIANEYDLEFWTYEGGPHPPGALSGHPFYQAYMSSAAIGQNYTQAIEVCREEGVQLLVHMGYCANPATSTWFLGPNPWDVQHAPRYIAFRAAHRPAAQDGGAH